MLNSKQRATLRGMANTIDTILQIGKSEVSDTLIRQVDDALTARELIKLRVLETAPYSPQEAAELVAEKTQSEVVQVIGTRFVLYRRNRKKPVIEI
ncbi:YhbY family RNA-binding protein [Acetanaerobacterium elongatum]|uniref:RNA-binding protein n=1 Tax=Acetanaerobacterium elongatum TaxID=258515 RepID=A0A1H0DM46_9FIRM|nr:YhbY family RNA-binding protein [Acetanaerobacterium elongatum]SDN71148.1 RNA-binding protein [Acetanaerobacterium elongatum]